MFVEKTYADVYEIDTLRIKEQLSKVLTDIAEFAFNQNLENWGKQFEHAKSVLDSRSPNEQYYHKDLIPLDNYSEAAKQVLFSAAMSWVFGGMGSWNDLGFKKKEDTQLHEKLSEQLYDDINQAIISSINSL